MKVIAPEPKVIGQTLMDLNESHWASGSGYEFHLYPEPIFLESLSFYIHEPLAQADSFI